MLLLGISKASPAEWMQAPSGMIALSRATKRESLFGIATLFQVEGGKGRVRGNKILVAVDAGVVEFHKWWGSLHHSILVQRHD